TTRGDIPMSGIETAFFGALAADAERKTSKAGKSYLRLRVRVGDGDGAQWLSVLCFDSDALAVADKLTKGARTYIEGRLELTEWTGQDGATKQGLSVLSFHTRLSQIGRQKAKRDRKDGSQESTPMWDDEVPF